MIEEWTATRGSPLAAKRIMVHRLLDARWRYGDETRSQSYKWLAQMMGLSRADCHVKKFDETKCDQAIELLERNK